MEQKKGDKHNDTKELNLKEFVYIGESLEKIIWLHNKAYTFDMKILGHTGLTIVLLWGDVLCRLALILSWVWIDASAHHYQVVNED